MNLPKIQMEHKFIIPRTCEGSYRVCGGFGNDEFTYNSDETYIHVCLERMKVRIGLAEVLKMMNLLKIQVKQKIRSVWNE